MNVITIEFCAEDRARIDRLIEALERKSCDACVNGALSWAEQVAAVQKTAAENGFDPVQQKLAETLAKASGTAEASKNATPAPSEAQASPTTHPAADDLPWGENTPSPEPERAGPPHVDLADFQKALTLRCAESEATKAKVRELLHEYAAAASQVPPEKRAEVLERLAKL